MTISFARHQFPPAIIRHAVWLYVRFTLSYRDVEDPLAERAGCLIRDGATVGFEVPDSARDNQRGNRQRECRRSADVEGKFDGKENMTHRGCSV